MSHYDDKTFFKDIKKEGQDYSDDIEDVLQGLNTNDESTDAFFVDKQD